MSRTKKLFVWSLLAIPMFALSSDLALAGKPNPLPNVRYRINYVSLPANAGTNRSFVLGSNYLGQVVGNYDVAGSPNDPNGWVRRAAFLYDPADVQQPVVDLNSYPMSLPSTYPAGYYLRAATCINGHQVVVGQLHDGNGNLRGFAIDLTMESPVLDLLPTNGSNYSFPRRINENGDILIVFESAPGVYGAFLYNPGYYGGQSIPRAPLDLSNTVIPSNWVIPVSLSNSVGFELNDPSSGRAAQVAGKTDSRFPFRYTMGAASIVEIPFAVSAVTALNDDGTFCGSALVRGKYVPFRYSNDKGKELLQTGALDTTAVDMNGSRDLIGAYNGVYRGDWGGWVALNNLVVGNTTDVNRWLANSHSLARIHDRAGTANSGVVVANDRGAIAVLTPGVIPNRASKISILS